MTERRPAPPWTPEFEALVRATIAAHRCGGGSVETIDPDESLRAQGLDSLAMLELGCALSRAYGVPLAAFTERALRSARSLWALVVRECTTYSLARRFVETARRHPDAVAVVDADGSRTYAQFHAEVAALAAGIGRGGVIAVLGERDVSLYRAYLAALYAGATVLPLSPQVPSERNAAIVRESGARLVLHTERAGDDAQFDAQLDALHGLDGVRLVAVSDAATDAGGITEPVPVGAEDAAYLLFTSGSTGRPKGVAVSQHNVESFVTAVLADYDTGPGDVFSQLHGMTFDLSVFELWGAWSSGASVVAVSRLAALDPPDTIAAHGVTVWTCTPSLMKHAANFGRLGAGSAPGVRHVVFCGEALPGDTARVTQAALPNAILDNAYGPCETTVWVSRLRIGAGEPVPDAAVVPLGMALPGVALRVDDAGELEIGGDQVAPGYLDSRLDEGRFYTEAGVRWYRTGDLAGYDGAGQLHYPGRCDGQVKIRGFRVELGEIEHRATRLLSGTRTAALLAGDEAGPLLVLMVEADSVDAEWLRAQLTAQMPDYMVPSRVMACGEFRLTGNGKLDREHLLERARLAGEPDRGPDRVLVEAGRPR